MTADWQCRDVANVVTFSGVNISMASRISDYPREVNSFSINLRIATFSEITRKTWCAESSMEENRRCARTSCARGKNRGYTSPIFVLLLVAISENFFRHILVSKFHSLLRYYENSLLWRRAIKEKYALLQRALRSVTHENTRTDIIS